MTTNAGGHTAATMKATLHEWADQQPTITRCAFCPWTYQGTAQDGRLLAAGHRRAHHPEAKPTRRRRGSLQRFNASDDGWRAEGIAAAAKVAASLRRLEDVA